MDQQASVLAITAGPHSHCTEPQQFVVPGSRDEVYEKFVQFFWIQGGGLGRPQVVAAGESPSYQGSTRMAGPIKEHIFRAQFAQELQYTILSVFPVSTYKAIITFEEAEGGSTKISWRAEFTPLIPFTGGLVKYFIETQVFAKVLRGFQSKLQKSKL
ncbi:hypothetical protein BASA81_006566 [Batrachochytrium salamandrivorans]|nr:hypothetical protein BASA81_006566 [Batrachochytrium salamandrivorans]